MFFFLAFLSNLYLGIGKDVLKTSFFFHLPFIVVLSIIYVMHVIKYEELNKTLSKKALFVKTKNKEFWIPNFAIFAIDHFEEEIYLTEEFINSLDVKNDYYDMNQEIIKEVIVI